MSQRPNEAPGGGWYVSPGPSTRSRRFLSANPVGRRAVRWGPAEKHHASPGAFDPALRTLQALVA